MKVADSDNRSKYNIHVENASGLVIGDNATVTQHFSGAGTAGGTAIPSVDSARLVALADGVNRYFDLEEVRDLCFRLGVEYDDLGGAGKNGKVRELVTRVERNGRLPNLIALLKQLRSHVSWE